MARASCSQDESATDLQVAALLASKDAQAAIAAATVLTHAAAPMLQSAVNEEEEQEDLATQLKPLLLQLVSCGTPKAAKVAIRWDLHVFAR